MADSSKGKRQIAKATKKQLGYQLGRNVLDLISNIANQVRDLVEKGQVTDQRTRQLVTVQCAPDDIKRSLSTEQLIAIEDFISTWAIEPEAPPSPPAPPAAPAKPRRKRNP